MPKALPLPPVKTTHTVFAVFEDDVAALAVALKPAHAAFLTAKAFTGKPGSLVILPGDDGTLLAWFGLGARKAYNPLSFRSLPGQLPRGVWTLHVDGALDLRAIHVAWALGAYAFNRYKEAPKPVEAVLDDSLLDKGEKAAVAAEAAAHALVRDMVNTPANDMGPAGIEAEARKVAEAWGARIAVIAGDALLAANYPAVHAVGRAAAAGREPRFIEITWDAPGAPDAPVVVLVGKGVAFDTGGLDIKPSSGMGLMKKDMGGAAHALALGQWIMETGLEVRLRILIPAVENAISGGAMRPSDVLASRSGLTIEVGNTDAEGRLILADALARAGELSPDLTLDFATLTGAARVALGPEVVPFYCDDEDIVRRLEVASIAQQDPVWRMPLWPGYRDSLESDIADLRNDPASWAQAGSVTAGLFLQRFAPKTGAWVHFDLYAWNPRGRPGWPVGAEAQTLRAVYAMIRDFV
jgi:leucyl aminopeptidase